MLFVCQRVSASRQCFENPPLPNHFPNQSVLQGTVLHAIIDQEWLLMSCPHLHASPIIETYQDICWFPTHSFLSGCHWKPTRGELQNPALKLHILEQLNLGKMAATMMSLVSDGQKTQKRFHHENDGEKT